MDHGRILSASVAGIGGNVLLNNHSMSYHRAARATLELVQISLALSMIRDITITRIELIRDRRAVYFLAGK